MQTCGRILLTFRKSAPFGLIFNDLTPESSHLRWASTGAQVL